MAEICIEKEGSEICLFSVGFKRNLYRIITACTCMLACEWPLTSSVSKVNYGPDMNERDKLDMFECLVRGVS